MRLILLSFALVVIYALQLTAIEDDGSLLCLTFSSDVVMSAESLVAPTSAESETVGKSYPFMYYILTSEFGEIAQFLNISSADSSSNRVCFDSPPSPAVDDCAITVLERLSVCSAASTSLCNQGMTVRLSGDCSGEISLPISFPASCEESFLNIAIPNDSAEMEGQFCLDTSSAPSYYLNFSGTTTTVNHNSITSTQYVPDCSSSTVYNLGVESFQVTVDDVGSTVVLGGTSTDYPIVHQYSYEEITSFAIYDLNRAELSWWMTITDSQMEAAYDSCVTSNQCNYFLFDSSSTTTAPATFSDFQLSVEKVIDLSGAELLYYQRKWYPSSLDWAVNHLIERTYDNPAYLTDISPLYLGVRSSGFGYEVFNSTIIESVTDQFSVSVRHTSSDGLVAFSANGDNVDVEGSFVKLDPYPTISLGDEVFILLSRPSSDLETSPFDLSKVENVVFSESANPIITSSSYEIEACSETSWDNSLRNTECDSVYNCELSESSVFDVEAACHLYPRTRSVSFSMLLKDEPSIDNAAVFSTKPLVATFTASPAAPYDFYTADLALSVETSADANVTISCDTGDTTKEIIAVPDGTVTRTTTLTLPTYYGRWRDRCLFDVPEPKLGGCAASIVSLGTDTLVVNTTVTNSGTLDGTFTGYVTVASAEGDFAATEQFDVAIEGSPLAAGVTVLSYSFAVPEDAAGFTATATCHLSAEFDDCWFQSGLDELNADASDTITRVVGTVEDVGPIDSIAAAVTQLHTRVIATAVATVLAVLSPWLPDTTPDLVVVQVATGIGLGALGLASATVLGGALLALSWLKV
ncbi:hypothetical protein J8273_0301 [Carpediemonas membranifera]|uniref:CARDB domain-containing protein n=1 Tax=Carpediemonas membranifera TaxID=201153 RepID=A0A8J6AZB8_9EUKA|nr:hypothetical protein J8273_0301 [Carpediemonas membranifera]|eukprot:KAG9395085.1 hypothetical protein J8273_0301 [Carpediemonas membranifera]